MSSQFLPKLSKYIPLWQRQIPRYPIHWKGNPQLRVFLPLFWMKMIKYDKNLAKDTLTFEVHFQMTEHDVKNYLEKIYNVPVLSVETKIIRGEERQHPKFGFSIQPDRDKRLAFVQLAEDHEFAFPDLFGKKQTVDRKAEKDARKESIRVEKDLREHWNVQDLPPWFQ